MALNLDDRSRERMLEWKAVADRQRELLRRSSNWFKANYSYIYKDKDTMQLWKDIDNELTPSP